MKGSKLYPFSLIPSSPSSSSSFLPFPRETSLYIALVVFELAVSLPLSLSFVLTRQGKQEYKLIIPFLGAGAAPREDELQSIIFSATADRLCACL